MQSQYFRSNMTTRWSCRAGDYIIWIGCNGFFAVPKDRFRVNDVWQMKDGDFLTITNRWQDLPSWFDLHPEEVSGSLSFWMLKRLKAGYKPQEPLEGPNIWRIFAGDRLAWVGPSRPDIPATDGVLVVLDFRDNALVVGEPLHVWNGFPHFGGFEQGEHQNPWGAALR